MTLEKYLYPNSAKALEVYTLPSSAKVREILQSLPEEQVDFKHGSWMVHVDGKRAKMGFLYEYLIAGRVSEVFGKYAPQAKHCFNNVKVEGAMATLFAVKTAKQYTKRGWIMRPILIPNNPKFEPLASKISDYIKSYGANEYPFMLHKNPETSKRYAEAYIKQIFEGYSWNFIDYTRLASAHPSLGFNYDLLTRKRKMLTQEEALAYGEKVAFGTILGWIPISIRIDKRWKEVNTNGLRKVRLLDLQQIYGFDSYMMAIYAGWKPQEAQVARHYINIDALEHDIDEDPTLPRLLAQIGKKYFEKFKVPISNLLNPLEAEFDGIEFV